MIDISTDFGLAYRKPAFFPLLGDGIFVQDGAEWKHSRELLRPQFSRSRMQNVDYLYKHIDNLLLAVSHDDGPVDLQPLFYRFTLDTSTSLIFGRSTNSLISDAAKEKETSFANAWDIAQRGMAARSSLGGFYWLIRSRKFRRACVEVHAFVDGMVADALETLASRAADEKKTDGAVETILQTLIQETKDPVTLRSTCLHILLAGRDTTASLLSWTL